MKGVLHINGSFTFEEANNLCKVLELQNKNLFVVITDKDKCDSETKFYELDENENKETYNSFTKIIQGIVKTLDISPSELNDLVNSANGFWQKMYP